MYPPDRWRDLGSWGCSARASATHPASCPAAPAVVMAHPVHGRVVEAPECAFHRLNEEHGYIDITRAGREFAVGERLHIIPSHVCVAVNLHETVYGKRGYQVEEVWKVEGRGKLQ